MKELSSFDIGARICWTLCTRIRSLDHRRPKLLPADAASLCCADVWMQKISGKLKTTWIEYEKRQATHTLPPCIIWVLVLFLSLLYSFSLFSLCVVTAMQTLLLCCGRNYSSLFLHSFQTLDRCCTCISVQKASQVEILIFLKMLTYFFLLWINESLLIKTVMTASFSPTGCNRRLFVFFMAAPRKLHE